MKRSTINDVAERAGVSVATVSRALRGLPNVSVTTRQRVQDAAADLNYAIDARASSLASGRTNLIGLVAPLFTSWYASQVVGGVEEALSMRGMDLLIYSIDRPENRHAIFSDRLRTRLVDGLILVDFFVDDDHRDQLMALGAELVTIGERVPGHSSLTIDNVAGAGLAVEHLIDLGHTNIAYVGGEQEGSYPSPVNDLRHAGVVAALKAAGIADCVREYDGCFTIAGGAAAGERLIAAADRPTAVFCGSDEMAAGVIAAARRAGLDVPGDLSVVGFDDHEVATAIGLTTVHQPVMAAGAQAAEMLLAVLDGDDQRDDIELPLSLLERSTTAPPR